jgi:C1A family cysteine protease
MNYRPEKLNIPRSEKPLKSTLNAASLPSYDWRSYNRVTPVKDQKSCGSCWAFASTAQYESLLMVGTNGTTYDLAEQYALECDKSSSGCNGGNPYSALGLIKSTGIPLESSYPYQYQSDSYYKSQSKPICSDTSRIKLTQSVISLKYYSNLSEE